MHLRSERVEEFRELGIEAFTTTRDAGSFSTMTAEPVRDVSERWNALRARIRRLGPRFATATQVHGTHIIEHATSWSGWLRADEGDGHVAIERGTGMAVTIADCVPVFIAHPSGAIALLHSGWRGTADRIVERGIALLARDRRRANELRVHLGPGICGKCYQVSADVYGCLTGHTVSGPTCVDLRAVIADHARRAGVTRITVSERCTRCDNDRFFSHRAGDDGRQVAVMMAGARDSAVLDSP